MTDEETPRERPANPNKTVYPEQTAAERARVPQNNPGTVPGDLHSGHRPHRENGAETGEAPKPKAARKRSVKK